MTYITLDDFLKWKYERIELRTKRKHKHSRIATQECSIFLKIIKRDYFTHITSMRCSSAFDINHSLYKISLTDFLVSESNMAGNFFLTINIS